MIKKYLKAWFRSKRLQKDYEELFQEFVILQDQYAILERKVREYLKRPSSDGAPVRQKLRAQLREMIGL